MAALHYLRSHFEEATEIYKKLLIENKDFHAINIYVALCYYKMDYYDVSLEILAVYLGLYADSIVGVNLKACNHFQLYNGKAAEAELKTLQAGKPKNELPGAGKAKKVVLQAVDKNIGDLSSTNTAGQDHGSIWIVVVGRCLSSHRGQL